MKENLHEANIVLAVIGIIERSARTRVEDIENGILRDLEKYHMAKLENVNRLKRVPYDEKLAGMCPPEWDPNYKPIKPPTMIEPHSPSSEVSTYYDNDLWWGA
jgi:hypothetical protein